MLKILLVILLSTHVPLQTTMYVRGWITVLGGPTMPTSFWEGIVKGSGAGEGEAEIIDRLPVKGS